MEWLLLGPLAVLIDSDFRKRQVSLVLLLIFGILQASICLQEMDTVDFLHRTGLNFLLLVVWGAGISIWAGLRHKLYRRPGFPDLNHLIGKGDLAFVLCFLPVFPLRGFLIFLLCAFALGLIYWLLFLSSSGKTIPLVSMLGICYLLVLILEIYGH